MQYFDSRDMPLGVKHVMASGALPPAFPAVRIDGELYWDGGILSNTPTEAIFDDNPRKNSLIFAVHLWNPMGRRAELDLGGAQPAKGHPVFQPRRQPHRAPAQTHRLRHIISELARRLPESEPNNAAVRELAAYGCPTRMHVVRLLAPQLDNENHTKDVDFSPGGIRMRWEAGYEKTMRGARTRALGAASSIRSRASSCTSRLRSYRWQRNDGGGIRKIRRPMIGIFASAACRPEGRY